MENAYRCKAVAWGEMGLCEKNFLFFCVDIFDIRETMRNFAALFVK
jgi:hypothetical protein